VNTWRDRRPFQRPEQVGLVELALFVVVPAILPALFSNERVVRSLAVMAINVAILGVVYVVTGYGLLPMIRFGAKQLARRTTELGQLMARSLPLLLLLTTFVFLNAEMWQVASDFAPAFYAIAVSFIVLSAMGFLAMRAPREVADLECFGSWSEVEDLIADTDAPLVGMGPCHPDEPPDVEPLSRTDRANVSLLLVISQLVQVVLVGLVIGAFYVIFGLLAVREATISQWTTSPHEPLATLDLFGSAIVVTWEHLAVAGFIGAFSALQFAVSMATDSAYRDEFYEEVTAEIREVLAVRTLYLDRLAGPGAEVKT